MWRQRQDGETVIFQGVVRRIDRHRDFGFIARDEKDVTDEVPRRFDIFFSPRHVDQGVSVDDVVQYTRIRKSEGFVATDVRLVLEPDSDQDRKISRSEKPLARQNDSGDGDGFGAGRGRSGGGWRGGGGGGGRGDGGGRSSYVKQEYPSGWYAERIYRGRCVSVFSTYGFICPSGRTREDPTENVFFHFNELGYGQSGVPIGQSVTFKLATRREKIVGVEVNTESEYQQSLEMSRSPRRSTSDVVLKASEVPPYLAETSIRQQVGPTHSPRQTASRSSPKSKPLLPPSLPIPVSLPMMVHSSSSVPFISLVSPRPQSSALMSPRPQSSALMSPRPQSSALMSPRPQSSALMSPRFVGPPVTFDTYIATPWSPVSDDGHNTEQYGTVTDDVRNELLRIRQTRPPSPPSPPVTRHHPHISTLALPPPPPTSSVVLKTATSDSMSPVSYNREDRSVMRPGHSQTRSIQRTFLFPNTSVMPSTEVDKMVHRVRESAGSRQHVSVASVEDGLTDDLVQVAEWRPRPKPTPTSALREIETKESLPVWDVETLLAALPQDVVNWEIRDGEVVAVRDLEHRDLDHQPSNSFDQRRDSDVSGLIETPNIARIGLWKERRVFANSRDFYLALLM